MKFLDGYEVFGFEEASDDGNESGAIPTNIRQAVVGIARGELRKIVRSELTALLAREHSAVTRARKGGR